MDQDDVALQFVSFTLAYPPLPRFPSGNLAEFFAKVQDVYEFEAFQQQGDAGATFSTEARRRLEIGRNEIQFEATTVSEHIETLRKEVTALIAEALMYFRIRTFILPSVTMRAIWQAPLGGTDVGDFIQDKVAISDEAKALLGGVSGLSMTLAGHAGAVDDPEHRHWDLEIAPYLRERDKGSVWIELSTHFMAAYGADQSVDSALSTCYDFLSKNVTSFLTSLFETEGG